MNDTYNLDALFAEIEANHAYELCNNEGEIDAFALEHDYRFPDDMRIFYRHYKTVRLFLDKWGYGMYRFVPIEEIHPTRIDVLGEDTDECGPKHWLTVCDVQDGNFVAIDINTVEGNTANYIDCFHETFALPGECKIVAKTFTEFLGRALSSTDNLFYLQLDFVGYGDGRPLTAENASLRCENPEPQKSGWIVRCLHNGHAYNEYFLDGEYGSPEASFKAVEHYVDQILDPSIEPAPPGHKPKALLSPTSQLQPGSVNKQSITLWEKILAWLGFHSKHS